MTTQLHPDDALFHAAGNDPSAFESYWFSFFEPQRKLMVYVYPWFRPNLGIAGGGVSAWDHRAAEPWTIVHCDYNWSLPCPSAAQMIDGTTITLPQGISIKVLEPLMRFEVSYSHPRLSLNVVFDAMHPAIIATRPIGNTQLFAGRIDQCGRVTGELVLGDEKVAIDCLSMRDRSWGPRRDDNRDLNIGYFHATASERDAFLVCSNHAHPTDGLSNDVGAPVAFGYLIQDAVYHAVTSGSVTYTRDERGWPSTAEIEAVDAGGRKLSASGRALTHFASLATQGLFNLSSLADWQFNGRSCLGELQNTMHPDKWRSFHGRRRPRG